MLIQDILELGPCSRYVCGSGPSALLLQIFDGDSDLPIKKIVNRMTQLGCNNVDISWIFSSVLMPRELQEMALTLTDRCHYDPVRDLWIENSDKLLSKYGRRRKIRFHPMTAYSAAGVVWAWDQVYSVRPYWELRPEMNPHVNSKLLEGFIVRTGKPSRG